MKRRIFWILVASAILIGCTSHMSYTRSSTNDIPFDKRRPPSGERCVIIRVEGPQLDPRYYDILGKVTSEVENMLKFEKHCQDAIKLIRFEAETVGADALINVSCRSGEFDAKAQGTAIAFKNREEAMSILGAIGAILE
jgi:hypothetical protein